MSSKVWWVKDFGDGWIYTEDEKEVKKYRMDGHHIDEMEVPSSVDELTRDTLKKETLALLEQCTEDQREFFHRIHTNSPWKGFDNVPEKEIAQSYDLVRRTVINNIRKSR